LIEENHSFSDLPAALVEEVLAKASSVGDLFLDTFHQVKKDRNTYRKALINEKIVIHESELGYPPLPTTCGTDGSYAIDRLLTADLVAAAAVAVEGLTPPSEKRYWAQPHHSTFITAEVHNSETATILRAVMLGRELIMADSAPHDLVMIDGTLTLPIIYFNQALNKAPEFSSLHCSQEFISNCVNYLETYRNILHSERSDKNFVSIPKYSTRREIGFRVGWRGEQDDRGILTLLLKPGELTCPLPLEQPKQEWHFNTSRLSQEVKKKVDVVAEDIVLGLKNVHVVYYKPHEWLPVLRMELACNIANNTYRLASVIHGIKHQCSTASMLEPYPLYLADRTVKALARAIPTFRQVTTQRVSELYNGDIGEVFLAMHGYRSEMGG